MHAVVVRVSISDVEAAEEFLQGQIVPQVKQAPGLVAGYWSRSDDGTNGMSMIVFEGEENARGLAQMLEGRPMEEGAVKLDSVEVREVVASAP